MLRADVRNLLDYDDHQHLPRTDRLLLAKTGNYMPLFTVTMRSGRTVTEKDAISAAIHEASVSAGYPEDDHFQRFISLEEADFASALSIPICRSLAASMS